MSALLLFAILAFVVAVCFAAVLNNWRERISAVVVHDQVAHAEVIDSPMVSLIVPARNAAETLAPLLQDLYAQRYPAERCEVLVVDDGSTDGTAPIVQGMRRSWPALSLVTNEGAGKKAAIMTGVQHAKGELVIMTDADARCGPLRVQFMVENWARTGADMLLGPVHTTGNGWLGTLQEDEQAALSAVGAGSALDGMPLLANGANMAFDRKAFTAIGGYSGDRYASGDDVFLLESMQRAGRTISFVLHREALVTVEAERTISGFWQQRLRWAGKMRGVRGAGKWVALAAMMAPWGLLAFTLSMDLIHAVDHGLFRVALLVGCAWLLWLVPQIALARQYVKFVGAERSAVGIGISALCFALYAPVIAIASLFVRPIWRERRI